MSPSQARLLARLEVPDCACPRTVPCGCPQPCDCKVIPAPPCQHIRAAGHDLSIREWAELLALAFPGQYDAPPPPPVPTAALSREARVAVMASRHARGLGLYHPDDMTEDLADDLLAHLGREAHRGRNGAVIAGKLGVEITIRRAA